jgi:hypothetical protein
MRKALPIPRHCLGIVLALSLAGCATSGSVSEQIKQAQDLAVQACKFLPTVATVAELFTAGFDLDGAVKALCEAVAPQPGAMVAKKGDPVVRGVRIRGDFVK